MCMRNCQNSSHSGRGVQNSGVCAYRTNNNTPSQATLYLEKTGKGRLREFSSNFNPLIGFYEHAHGNEYFLIGQNFHVILDNLLPLPIPIILEPNE